MVIRHWTYGKEPFRNLLLQLHGLLFSIINKGSFICTIPQTEQYITWPLLHRALNTFYLWLYGVTHMVKDHSDSEREETRCHHMGYSFQLAVRVLLYASSHSQDNTYHNLCYTSCGVLAGTRNSSMCPTCRIDPTTHCVMSKRSAIELLLTHFNLKL